MVPSAAARAARSNNRASRAASPRGPISLDKGGSLTKFSSGYRRQRNGAATLNPLRH
jgi:hypothetical protein